eukprot:9290303-Prorocentrum_lima.AAC.1
MQPVEKNGRRCNHPWYGHKMQPFEGECPHPAQWSNEELFATTTRKHGLDRQKVHGWNPMAAC